MVSTIANHYAKLGYKILWPARRPYFNLLERFDYVTPILLDDEALHSDPLRSDVIKIKRLSEYKTADLVLDLADRGEGQMQRPNENFEICKFRRAKLPLDVKFELNWRRDLQKEQELKSLVCPEGPYIFAHRTSSYLETADMPLQELPVVEAREIAGFDILDWTGVILGAEKVYSLESSFFHLIEGLTGKLKNKPILLKRSVINGPYRHCVAARWDHSFIGETFLMG